MGDALALGGEAVRVVVVSGSLERRRRDRRQRAGVGAGRGLAAAGAAAIAAVRRGEVLGLTSADKHIAFKALHSKRGHSRNCRGHFGNSTRHFGVRFQNHC